MAFILNLILPALVLSQTQVRCDHAKIDEKQLALQYSSSELTAVLGPLSYMGARMTVAPKTLQIADAATQQWNEYLKGLAAGWNACAITKEQYAEALQKLYPGLKQDGSAIDKLRQELAANRRIDEKRLAALLDAYTGKLKQFAEISGNGKLFREMEALAADVRGARAEQQQGFADVQAQLDDIKRAIESTPKPQDVKEKISALKSKMLARADEAEAEYNRGYESLNQFKLADAVSHFERASQIMPMAEFSLALGNALRLLPNLSKAERVLNNALSGALDLSADDNKIEADLRTQLGKILQYKGDLGSAQKEIERALAIDEKVYGHDHSTVAMDLSNLGSILRAQGDLEGAQKQTERAIAIDEKVDGPDNPHMATLAGNLGAILEDKGDLDGAQKQTERARAIDEKAYGPDHPNVAIRANNLGQILQAKGDLEGAQKQTKSALSIQEKVYGPNHPSVAIAAFNLGQILLEKGDLEGAQKQTERALAIDEKAYGPNHPAVATDLGGLGVVLEAKGELEGAQRQIERAVRILELRYGPDSPTTKTMRQDLEKIIKERSSR